MTMSKVTVECVVLLVVVLTSTSDAWLINRHWQTKRCFCKVVSDLNGVVLHDLGSIYSCKESLGCRCGHVKMRSCYNNCEQAVRRWSQTRCPTRFNGLTLRAHYKASDCHEGKTRERFGCSRVPFSGGGGGAHNGGNRNDIAPMQ